MIVQLTKSQIRRLVIDALVDRLEDKDSELNFAIKYVLCKAFRFGGDPTPYSQWELRNK